MQRIQRNQRATLLGFLVTIIFLSFVLTVWMSFGPSHKNESKESNEEYCEKDGTENKDTKTTSRVKPLMWWIGGPLTLAASVFGGKTLWRILKSTKEHQITKAWAALLTAMERGVEDDWTSKADVLMEEVMKYMENTPQEPTVEDPRTKLAGKTWWFMNRAKACSEQHRKSCVRTAIRAWILAAFSFDMKPDELERLIKNFMGLFEPK